MIRKMNDRRVEQKPAPFQGEGEITVRHLLNGDKELYDKGRVFCHSTLQPGCGLGYHVHTNEMEAYYIYSGHGQFNDNGVISEVTAGDVTLTQSGEGHALKNTGTEPLEFIALILYK